MLPEGIASRGILSADAAEYSSWMIPTPDLRRYPRRAKTSQGYQSLEFPFRAAHLALAALRAIAVRCLALVFFMRARTSAIACGLRFFAGFFFDVLTLATVAWKNITCKRNVS